MKYKKIKDIDKEISILGYGAWALAKHGWKDVNQKEAIATLEKSIEAGINFIDTAPIYGFGKSEEIIGEVIKGKRKDLVIASKFGLRWNKWGKVEHNISKDSILYEVEESLKRLKTDYIDLYQLHWPDNKTPYEEVFSTLEDLKREGLIKSIGVSNLSKEDLSKVSKEFNISTTQNCFNIIQNSAKDDIFPICKENHIGFIAYSPLAQGILSGKVNENYKFSKNDIRRFNELFKDRELWNRVNSLEKPLNKTALEYILSHDEISNILISMTKIKHLEENLNIINNF